jgi:glycosyltransferase involved in cell wall biosynthesis
MGGGQVVSLRIASALRTRGFAVRFASPSRGDFTRLSDAIGETDIVSGSSLRDLGAAREIEKYLRMCGAALVHTHTPAAATILWRMGARLASVPIVNHVHIFNYFGQAGLKSAAARSLDALTRGIPAAYIAVSDDTRNSLIADGYPADRITTIYNSIPWAREERLTQGIAYEPIIGCVGRISPAKGQKELLDAFASICSEVPRAKLWIVGSTDKSNRGYLDTLKSQAAESGFGDAVTFMGNRADVRDLLREMSVLVLPSWHEAFPIVLLEAMSVGVPVVATPVGGVGELVKDGDTGLLVEPGDVAALARTISRVLSFPALHDSLSRNAYDFVWSEFNESATLERVVALIVSEVSRAHRD